RLGRCAGRACVLGGRAGSRGGSAGGRAGSRGARAGGGAAGGAAACQATGVGAEARGFSATTAAARDRGGRKAARENAIQRRCGPGWLRVGFRSQGREEAVEREGQRERERPLVSARRAAVRRGPLD